MQLPNFLIIGTAKSGTTSLYHYLIQHPDIFMCEPKEPKFFAFEMEAPPLAGPGDLEFNRFMVTELDKYKQLFASSNGHRAVGEATAIYLYWPSAPQRIQHYVPKAKLIAILRDPAERAYSAFNHLRRQLREPIKDFRTALTKEQERIRLGYHPLWYYKQLGLYYEQVKRYFDRFGREHLNVLFFDDYRTDSVAFVKKIYDILEIDTAFTPNTSEKFYDGVLPRSWAIGKGLKRLSHFNEKNALIPAPVRWRVTAGVAAMQKRNQKKPQKLNPEIRAELVGFFREDILRLQDLVQRDLSKWLRV